MILADREIRAALASGHLGIEPLADADAQIQPCSVDLRLSNVFRKLHATAEVSIIDARHPQIAPIYTDVRHWGGNFVIHPGQFVLGSTIERVRIPNDLLARVEGCSTFGRLGVLVHITAGFVDPGFAGEITLELKNVGPLPVALWPGDKICQIAFQTLTSAVERPYGPERGSKYQGQAGPTPARGK